VVIWERLGSEAIMRTSIAVAVLLVLCAGANAQTRTECGRSNGYAYYFSGGAVPAAGWKKDWIDGGQIILNFINGEADLLVPNATGSTASVRQAGGKIYLRKAVNGLIALTVFYDDTAITEDHVFQLDGQGNGNGGLDRYPNCYRYQ
jgi:hypothetical protein